MFTKNLKDQFSADLLNTVSGILGESKHDEECECEKCEEEEDEDEDEDENENGKKKMKEGFASAAQRKAVWATYADGGKGHPDKKKKMKKEEVEVAEAKKESTPFKGPYRKAGERKDEYGNKIKNVAKHLAKKAMMAREEVEQIDELSPRTLGNYVKRRQGDLLGSGMSMAQGDYSKDRMRRTSNAFTGMTRATNKLVKKALAKEEAEQIDEISKDAMASYVSGASKDLPRLTGKRQAEIRKTGLSGAEAGARKIKNRLKGIETAADRLRKEEAEQIDELSKKTLGSYVNKAADRMSTQGVTAGLKIAANEKSKKNFDNIAKRQKGIATAVSKLTKEEQDFIDALNDADVEQIDELSGATLGSYMVKSKKDETARKERGIKVRDEIRKQTGLNVGTPMDPKLYGRKMSRGYNQQVAMKKLTGQARVNAKEEFELEEGRGRPPKEGSAAWHAKQKQANDDMPALGVQLRKAKSMNKKVRFMNGKEHDIHPNHVDRFEDHMAARKTSQDKAAFQKQAHKSHEDFVKAVSAPVPKASKDTGEIVKYRH